MSNGMQSFDRRPPPMTAGARFIRGFRRIGLGVAGLAFCGGAVMTFIIAVEQNDRVQNTYTQAKCIEQMHTKRSGNFVFNQYSPLEIDLEKSGCSGPMYSEIIPIILEKAARRPAPLEGFVGPAYIGLLISAASATGIFLVFWLFGWICAGFTRD